MNFFRASILVFTLACVLGVLVGSSPAQPGGDLKKTVQEIATNLRKAKGDTKSSKELAEKTGKKIQETTELMAMFRLRSKGGLGVGSTAGPNSARDGIDAMIRELARNPSPILLKDTAALEEMGFMIAAMGAIVDAKGPPKTADQKGKKLWHEYAHDAHLTGLAFAKAAATKNPAMIKQAASKVNNACGGCHAFFK